MSGKSDSDFLDRLAESVADGASIDWDAEIGKLPADDRIRGLLELLRVVDGVAEVHRSFNDPSQATAPLPSPPQPDNVHPIEGIGQWRHLVLRRKIGEGGFGEVYDAYDPLLDHSVALKLFKPKGSNRDSANRLLHEARKLARIRHPNIVTVHGADSHNGQSGFWMDLIEGTTLEQFVRGGRLSAGEATSIGQEVCRALAAVHRAGIVHRDVKAQNVMRASDGGRIILMDFGAGEFMNDQTANARKQGTPLYLAPELFNGADASPRSDIYATGVLLYYLVTGDFPVRGASVQELKDAHQRGERQRLRDGRPDLPSQFVSVVERALDPDPARRFASAGEMESALAGGTGLLDPVAIPTPRPRLLQRILVGTAVAVGSPAIVGWIACRAFDLSLGVHSDFAAGPFDYLSVGAFALLPFGIFWSVGVGALAVLMSIGSLFRAPIAAARKRMPPLRVSADGATIATLVLVTGFACWIAIVWHCADIFVAMQSLSVPSSANALDPSILGSAGGPLQRTLFLSAAYLSLFLALAAWRWFPQFERGAVDTSRLRSLKLGTLVVASIAVVTASAPWRLVWERFEVVQFDHRPAFVIGSNNDELLLYFPYSDASKHRRVLRDAPALQRTGSQARLFDRQ